MNIVHICLTGGYTEGFNYQENYLTKYQALAGNKVTIITTQYCWHKNEWDYCFDSDYDNQYGVHIIRIPYKYKMIYKVQTYNGQFVGLKEKIESIKPNIIFIHNLQFWDLKVIANYKKEHKDTIIFADNHSDFSNSARNWISKNILYKLYWRHCAKIIEPYVEKFYGVLPARVDFLKDIYRIPKEKCELLVMGADDEEVEKNNDYDLQAKIRKEFGIEENEFVIVTGGKIDAWKTQTLLLMKAVIELDRIKLLIFGSVDTSIYSQFSNLCVNNKIIYAGWATSDQSYQYFSIADLVVFPGRHSVYWEQAAGQGKPMLCKYWEGTTHVDLGGNVEFLYKDSVEEIKDRINELLQNPNKFKKMKEIAEQRGIEVFSYKKIAERSIGVER